jgi:hypothetical protein
MGIAVRIWGTPHAYRQGLLRICMSGVPVRIMKLCHTGINIYNRFVPCRIVRTRLYIILPLSKCWLYIIRLSYFPIIYNRDWTPGYLEYNYRNSMHIAIVVQGIHVDSKKNTSPKLNVNRDIAHLTMMSSPLCCRTAPHPFRLILTHLPSSTYLADKSDYI